MSFNRTILQPLVEGKLAQSSAYKAFFVLLFLSFYQGYVSLAADTQSIDISKIESVQATGNNYQYIQDATYLFQQQSFTNLCIWKEQAFNRASHTETALFTSLFITEVLMGLMALLVFALYRDKTFLYYSFFAFAISAMFASTKGFIAYFISPSFCQIWMSFFNIGLVQIAALLFIRSFLNIKSYAPIIDKTIQIVIAVSAIGIVISLLGYPYYSRIISDITALSFILILPLGLYAWKKAVPYALIFTFSWVIFLAGMLMAALSVSSYIENAFLSQWLIYSGGFVEALLLTTVMITRFYGMRKSKISAEEAHKELLHTAANDLVSKVNRQSEELNLARQAAEKNIRIDLLTGLLNRKAFIESVTQFISRAKRTKTTSFHLVMLDIDHFKTINDTYGIAAGDSMLKAVAQVLKGTIRDIDTVSRIGGEEFAVLMENKDTAGATRLIERLRQAVKNLQMEIDDKKVCVTVTLGVSVWSEDSTFDDFLQNAETALYNAKEMGSNQVIFSE